MAENCWLAPTATEALAGKTEIELSDGLDDCPEFVKLLTGVLPAHPAAASANKSSRKNAIRREESISRIDACSRSACFQDSYPHTLKKAWTLSIQPISPVGQRGKRLVLSGLSADIGLASVTGARREDAAAWK